MPMPADAFDTMAFGHHSGNGGDVSARQCFRYRPLAEWRPFGPLYRSQRVVQGNGGFLAAHRIGCVVNLSIRRSLSGQPMAGCIEGAAEHQGNGGVHSLVRNKAPLAEWPSAPFDTAARGAATQGAEGCIEANGSRLSVRRSLSGGVAAVSKGAADRIVANRTAVI